MIRFILWLIWSAAPTMICAQVGDYAYDQKLADSLGADERGMKMYVLAILRTGSKSEVSQAQRDSLMKGHFGFINSMAEKGLLVIAGPLEKNDQQFRGIYVFNVATVEEARRMAEADPSIRSGFFALELFGFYGSAALPKLVPIHQKIQRQKPG